MKKRIQWAVFLAFSTFVSGSLASGVGKYEHIQTCEETHELVRGKIRLSALTGLPVGPVSLQQFRGPQDKILRPFESDGCSAEPYALRGVGNTAWLGCCVAHDAAYWRGGTFQERVQAEQELQVCMTQAGYPREAASYTAMTKQLGGPNTVNSYRWGFGWNYQRGYGPISASEEKQIQRMYQVGAQEVVARLIGQTTQVVEKCNTIDAAFTKLMSQEEVIFKDLNQKLKADTVIKKVLKDTNDRFKTLYTVSIESCKTPVVYSFKRGSEELLEVDSNCF